jgi:hypothetical protein
MGIARFRLKNEFRYFQSVAATLKYNGIDGMQFNKMPWTEKAFDLTLFLGYWDPYKKDQLHHKRENILSKRA